MSYEFQFTVAFCIAFLLGALIGALATIGVLTWVNHREERYSHEV